MGHRRAEDGGIGAHRDPRYGVGHGGQAWLMEGLRGLQRKRCTEVDLVNQARSDVRGSVAWVSAFALKNNALKYTFILSYMKYLSIFDTFQKQ